MMKLKQREIGQNGPDERSSKKQYREELEKKERIAKDEREGKITKSEDDSKRRKVEAIADNPFPEDADDDLPSEDKGDSDDDDDDEEEDTEELMRELAKIKKEREAEEAIAKAKVDKRDDRSKRDEVMKANPLLTGGGDMSLKRMWDDDTVFKNQSRMAPKPKQRYINDSVRSDFHKRFLGKYVWMDGHAGH